MFGSQQRHSGVAGEKQMQTRTRGGEKRMRLP